MDPDGCLAEVGKSPQSRNWQPTPRSLPGEPRGQRRLAGRSPWGRVHSDTAEPLRMYVQQKRGVPRLRTPRARREPMSDDVPLSEYSAQNSQLGMKSFDSNFAPWKPLGCPLHACGSQQKAGLLKISVFFFFSCY